MTTPIRLGREPRGPTTPNVEVSAHNFAVNAFHLRSLIRAGRSRGLEGIWDAAITNALVVIVHGCGGMVEKRPGHYLPARELVKNLRAVLPPEPNGDILVSVPKEGSPGPIFGEEDPGVADVTLVTVRAAVIEKSLDPTQGPRHGRTPTAPLTEDAIHAVELLEAHPALSRWTEEEHEAREADLQRADDYELGRAWDYWDNLDAEERERRSSLGGDAVESSTHEPLHADCPVCENKSMEIVETDDFGFGIASGTCLACSYSRSANAAEQEALQLKMEHLHKSSD